MVIILYFILCPMKYNVRVSDRMGTKGNEMEALAQHPYFIFNNEFMNSSRRSVVVT